MKPLFLSLLLPPKEKSQTAKPKATFFLMDAGASTTTRELLAHAPPPPVSALPVSLQQASADPSNPFPTTFVQADTTSFKQVVQILTGTQETAAAAAAQAPQKPAPPGPKKPVFKLYERRNSTKSLKMLCPLLPAFAAAGGSPRGLSPRGMELLSPSTLDFPSLALGSPVTPLPGSAEAAAAEDRAIAGKGFYLHPSPRGNAGDPQPPPRLLPLFPVQSPTRP
jgi:hypothetical protein